MVDNWGQFEELGKDSQNTSHEVLQQVTEELTQGTASLIEKDRTLDNPLSRRKGSSIWSPRNQQLSNNFLTSPSCPDFGSLEAAHNRVIESGLTISEAKSALWKLRVAGPLLKRGFRHRKRWARRWVVLAGRNLSYYDEARGEEKGTLRGCLELKKGTRVVPTDSRDGTFGFEVVPPGVESSESRAYASRMQAAGRSSSTVVRGTRSPIVSPDQGRSRAATMRRSYSTVSQQSSAYPWFSSDQQNQQERLRNHRSRGDSAHLTVSVIPKTENGNDGLSSRRQPGWLQWFFGGNDYEFNQNETCLWRFRAPTESSRKKWIEAIEKSIALVSRVEVGPTLCGVGSIQDHYRLGPLIDSGTYGVVRLAVAKNTGKRYAVRVVDKSSNVKSPEAARGLKKEIKVMRRATRQVSHPGLFKLLQAYEDDFTVYLVTDFIGGRSIEQRVSKFGPFTEVDAASVVEQVASALHALHESGIVMCDMRPDTIRFNSEWSMQVKLTHFANAVIFAQKPNQKSASGTDRKNSIGVVKGVSPLTGFTVLRHMVGSPGLLAPEVVNGRKYSAAGDMWALGCILFFALTGERPFVGPTPQAVARAVSEGLQAAQVHQGHWDGISKGARRVVGSLLNVVRERRATPAQVLQDEWILDPSAGSAQPTSSRHADSRRYHARQKIRIAILAVAASIRLARRRNFPADVLPSQRQIEGRWRTHSDNSSASAMSPRCPTPVGLRSVGEGRDSPTGADSLRLSDRSNRLTLDGRAGRVRALSSEELNPAIIPPVRLEDREGSAETTASSEHVDECLYSDVRSAVRQQGPFLTALVQELENVSTGRAQEEV